MRGFSLVEAVVAGVLLLLTCVSVSTLISAALRAEGAAQRRSGLEAALAAERERLATLPYYRAVATPAELAVGTSPSLVGEVFPHALEAYNTAGAFFRGGEAAGEPASFVTVASVTSDSSASVQVERTASFLGRWPASPLPLGPSELEGWAVWRRELPPGGALEVRVEAESGGERAACVVTLGAPRVRFEASPVPVAGVGDGS
jgi:hypothetical protein